ncbi:MAG: acyltransferase family protein [Coprobacillus sp.]
MERNRTIDFMKFILSIGVIAIHAQVFFFVSPVLYKTITMGLLRIGVPFFFVVSGYFYYQRIMQGKETKSYIMKLIKIFLTFEAIEIIFLLVPMSSSLQPNAMIGYLWTALSVGLGGAYWFLISLILSLIFLTLFWKKKKIYPLLIIGLLLYLFVFTIDSYGGFFKGTEIQLLASLHTSLWKWPQAGLCSSLFYLSLGALIYEKKPKIPYLNIALILSLIGLMLEAYFLQSHGAMDGNCYVMLIISVPLLVMWCLNHPQLSFDTSRLGKMSLYIYMVHPIVLSLIRWLFPIPYEFLFIFAAIISVAIAYRITSKNYYA